LGGAFASSFSACTAAKADDKNPAATVAVTGKLPNLNGLPPQKSYHSVKISSPYLSQTFDDGPHPVNTPELLNLLAKNDIKATFFMVGSNVERYPNIVKRMVDEGHEVANHSYSHPALNQLSEAEVDSQISRTQEAITKACGVTPKLMRPPYGAFNARLIEKMRSDYGLTTIFWSVDPDDWKRPGSSVVASRILSEARDGSIILSHDIHGGTIEAMYTVLPGLKDKGFKPVTTGQLIALASSGTAPAQAPQAPGTQEQAPEMPTTEGAPEKPTEKPATQG